MVLAEEEEVTIENKKKGNHIVALDFQEKSITENIYNLMLGKEKDM